MDVSRINGYPVQGLDAAEGPGADKAKRAAANLEAWAKANPDVNQIIGPNDGWNKSGKARDVFTPIKDKALLDEHKDHYHINVRRK